jgi:hypothetical protein
MQPTRYKTQSDKMPRINSDFFNSHSAGTPTSSSASTPHSYDTEATPPSPVRQNAEPIPALDGFKRVLKEIKYQLFMPDPSGA